MAVYTEKKKVVVVGMPNGEIEEVTTVVDLKDGKPIGSSKHTRVIAPGANITAETAQVQAIARGLWTPAAVAAMTTEQQARITELRAEQAKVAAEIAALKLKQAELEALKQVA